MNQQQRDAMRERIVQIIEAAGPDGLDFADLYDSVAREFTATRRNVQDQILRAEQAGEVAVVGLRCGNRCTYKHTRYKSQIGEQQRDRADIYAFRPLKTVFAGIKPARFDVR